MYQNRASYQKINPNMSTHMTPKPKQACFALNDGNTLTFHEVTETTLKLVAKHWPDRTPSKILIDMLNGKSFSCLAMTVSIVYK
jgi:hypothetical protein